MGNEQDHTGNKLGLNWIHKLNKMIFNMNNLFLVVLFVAEVSSKQVFRVNNLFPCLSLLDVSALTVSASSWGNHVHTFHTSTPILTVT